jgi:hypothetical protein
MKMSEKNAVLNRLFVVLSFAVPPFFLALNFLTPLIADDFSLSFVFGTDRRISSWGDLFLSDYNYYMTWGGRSVAGFWTMLFLWLPKPVFNCVNTLVYCALGVLMCYHIVGSLKKISPILFVAVNAGFWFLVPAWGQDFLMLTAACLYSWTAFTILVFLVPFRKRLENAEYRLTIPLSVCFFGVGVLAGWGVENSGAAVLFLLIAYFLIKLKRKDGLALFEVLGAIGFVIGFCLLIAAPGNYARASSFHQDTAFILILLRRLAVITVMVFRGGGLPLLFLAFLCFDMVYHQKRRINAFTCLYGLAALTGAYSMLLAPYFPDRAFLIVIVFSGIALGNTVRQFEFQPTDIIKRNFRVISFVFLAFFAVSVLAATRNITGIYLRWQDRVAYIMAEKEKGNLKLEVKAPIPAIDNHSASYGLDDILDGEADWPNTSIARYFGIESIKRLNNSDPWEPAWKNILKKRDG